MGTIAKSTPLKLDYGGTVLGACCIQDGVCIPSIRG